MNSKILKSIIKITEQRDVDSLEYSLLATLAEVIPDCCELSIFKLLGDKLTDEIEQVVHLVISQNDNVDSRYSWSDAPTVVDVNEHVSRCIQTHSIFKYQDEAGLTHLLLPVTHAKTVIGVLDIAGTANPEEQQELIQGFVSIYENYLVILNESERDKLTGLFNRRNFDVKLDRLLQIQRNKQLECIEKSKGDNQRQLADDAQTWLIILDIDHFKAVNDEYGHVYGDEVLLTLSQMMKSCFRSSDLLFRFGGEEFVIILEPISFEMAQRTLERFRSTVEKHDFPLVGTITVSLGFAKIDAADYPPTILEYADKALYYAKEHGRNCIHSYEMLIDNGELTKPVETHTVDLF
jgi:diguanylate cyclase (GGDEF)-like protein